MSEVEVGIARLERFTPLVGEVLVEEVLRAAAELRHRLSGRVLWNINSTATGGGVAEMLRALVPYVRGAGINSRWQVISGPPEFFQLTKRLHRALHGIPGDDLRLQPADRELYERVLGEWAGWFCPMLQRGDIVLVHDPQPAGLIPYLKRAGAHVIWRCHIGAEASSPQTQAAWDFLLPYVSMAAAAVFSRWVYVPPELARRATAVIPPSVDPFSAKNQELPEEAVHAILSAGGLVDGPPRSPPAFLRSDGTEGRVTRRAEVFREGGPPRWEVPLVVQVSRWDHLKDPVGVLRGFCRGLSGEEAGAQLVLAGPSLRSVADDPEGTTVFAELVAAWQRLAPERRRRVHLANLPMLDVEENAALVNALQRHAAVVVQKSLAEGFGLTVAEAMWKGRPVVASAVGGIKDQIEDGTDGILLRDPRSDEEFARALGSVLGDPALAHRLGRNARESVGRRFLAIHALRRYAELILGLL